MQASCQLPTDVQHSKVTQQLQLLSNRHKAKAQSKGSLDFGVWLGPTGDVLGRLGEGKIFSLHADMLTALVLCKMRQLSDICDAAVMQIIIHLTCPAASSAAGIHHHVVRCVYMHAGQCQMPAPACQLSQSRTRCQ